MKLPFNFVRAEVRSLPFPLFLVEGQKVISSYPSVGSPNSLFICLEKFPSWRITSQIWSLRSSSRWLRKLIVKSLLIE